MAKEVQITRGQIRKDKRHHDRLEFPSSRMKLKSMIVGSKEREGGLLALRKDLIDAGATN